jgi:hypothetical protein
VNVRAATSGGTGTAAGGGITEGSVLGAAADGLGRRGGGVTVVTVSGGRVALGRGVAVMVRLGGTTTVADVEALSPPLTITTVAITASAKMMPAIAAIGRQRSSTGAYRSSPSA